MPLPLAVGAALGLLNAGRFVRLAVIISVLATATGALALTLGGFLNALQVVVPPELGLGLGLMPSNTPACLSALVVCVGVRWAYDVHAKLLLAVGSGGL